MSGATCPLLGLRDDPDSIHAAASGEHRCYAARPARHIDLAYQERNCLTPDYSHCPLYQAHGAASPVAPVDADEEPADANRTSHSIDRWIPLVAVVVILLAIGYVFSLFATLPLAPAGPPLPPNAQPSRALTPLRQPATSTATATARSTPAVTSRVESAPPAPPAGGQLFSLTPAPDGAGWVVSGERTGNHLGDAVVQAGQFGGSAYLGLLQFDLNSIPAGTRIVFARLELLGAREERAPSGNWQLKLVSVPAGLRWASVTYDDASNLPWDTLLPPALSRADVARRRINRFDFPAAALTGAERQFGRGKLTVRIEGAPSECDSLFAWDSGTGAGNLGFRPILYVGTDALPATPTATPLPLVVLPCVPTPESMAARQALAATATQNALDRGTPTPYPPNFVTPFLTTPSATPQSVFTAAALAAQATLDAARIGTATPTPPNGVFPYIVTNTPTPANAAETTAQAAFATAQALARGTPTPLPCFVWTATPEPPTPVVVYATPATPTREPTATPTAIPAVLRGQIGFISDRDGAPAVYVMQPDGSQVGRLTNRWAYDAANARQLLSADGLFRLSVSGNLVVGAKLLLTDLARGNERLLVANGGVNYDPAFAPDGYGIVFVSTVTGRDELYRINRDGSGYAQLTNSQWEWNKHPSWSPDGTRIVAWSNRETGRRQLWLLNSDGSGAVNISANAWNDWDAVWFR